MGPSSDPLPPLVHTIPITKLALDFFLLMCVGFPILFLFLWGEPYKRGFFCDDDDLQHPYHESTVPSIYLYIIGIVMNVIMMILIEYLNSSCSRNKSDEEIVYLMGKKVPKWLYNCYTVLIVFAFGMACSQLTTDVLKYSIGRFRPHFLYVCVPDVCSIGSAPHKYWLDFNCTNQKYLNNKRILKEMRLSFPSGHSSFSMYSMLYFSIYLQKRMKWTGSSLLKHTIQFVAVLSALFTACTRVSDYKHHWSDVLLGLLIGTITACITAYGFSNLFARKKHSLNNLLYRNTATTEFELQNGHRHTV